MRKFLLLVLALILVMGVNATVVYVDVDATGTGDGTTWQNAFTDLSQAIESAQSGDEVWVAAGIYYPTSQPNYEIGSADDKFNHFTLKNGVTLYGGFAGDETSVAQRDLTANKTVLSGDIDQNDDVEGEGYVADYTKVNGRNSLKLFYFPEGTSIDTTAVLDGFVLTGAVADNDVFPYMGGAAFLCQDASPKIVNCAFYGNYAKHTGGAIWLNRSSMIIENCVFEGNKALKHAGAFYYTNSEVSLKNCSFINNEGGYGGAIGGYFNEFVTVFENCKFENNIALGNAGVMTTGETPNIFIECTFTNNQAPWGGALVLYTESSSEIINCTFEGNHATDSDGGAIYAQTSNVNIYNSSFKGNEAHNNGGAIINVSGSDLTAYNSLFSGNVNGKRITVDGTTNSGSAVYSRLSKVNLINSTVVSNYSYDNTNGAGVNNWDAEMTIQNCIIWNNRGAQQIRLSGSATVEVMNSTVQGGYSGSGNLDVYPLFLNPVSPSTTPSTQGDYKLWGNSPANNKGINSYLPKDTYDLDNDGDTDEPLPVDLYGNERVFAGIVDMGCFEQQFESVSGNKLSVWMNQHVDMGTGLTLNNTNFTIEMWLYPRSDLDGNFHGICGNKYNNGSLRGPSMYIFQKDRIHYGYGDGTNWNSGDTEKALKTGQWNHIAMTFNDGSNTLSLYSNGKLLEQASFPGNEVLDEPLQFINQSLSMIGYIDEFRVWKEERTQEELIANMNSTLSGNEDNLALYYSFDQVTGDNTIEDQAGNNNGTLINIPGIFNSDAILTPILKPVQNVGIDNFTISWYPVPDAFDYYIDVATDPEFKNLVKFGEPTNGATTFDVNGLSKGTVYYYKVTVRTNNDDWGRQYAHTATKLTPPGNAFVFDGLTYVNANDVTKYEFSGTTIETWVKVDADQLNSKWALWACNPTDYLNNYVLFYGTNGEMFSLSQFDYNAGSWAGDNFDGSTLTADTWHHVAVVIDKDNNLGKLYLDGEVKGSFTPLAHPYPYGSYFSIGQEFDDGAVDSDHIKGSMDEFRIWSKALTQSEIQGNMYNALTGNEEDLVTYYNFDLQTGNKVVDNANIFDGEIIGNINWVESTVGLQDFVVEASSQTTSGFTLNWSAVAGATDYLIDVATDAQFTNQVISSAATNNETTYDATGLEQGIKYYFRVATDQNDTSLTNYTNTLMEVPGNALVFDGKDDFVDISQITELGDKNYVTMECWAYVDPTETHGRFLAINTATGGNKYLLSYEGGKGYSLFDANAGINITSNDLSKGTWMHLAVTMEAYGTVSFYLNGKLIGTSNNGHPPLFSGNLISIGQEYDGDRKGDFLKGAVDEVRFWDRILSGDEIRANMHKKMAGNEAGLFAYYDFDQIEGQFLYEKVNGLDGTIISRPEWAQSEALITPIWFGMDAVGYDYFEFGWWEVDGASEYKLQVATDREFANIVDERTVTVSHQVVDGLEENTDYYFRLASNTSRWSAWSPIQKVSTLLIPPGNTLAFDGTTYISMDDVTNENYNNGATVDLWVKPIEHEGNRSMIWANNTTTGGNHYVLNYNPIDKILYLWGSDVEIPVNLNETWNHIAVVIKNNLPSYIYINGKEMATFTEAQAPLLANSRFSIGQEWDDDVPSDFFHGDIDEVRIWNKALSLEELQSYAHTSIPGNEPGLIAYFNFDETEGSYVYDANGSYSGQVIGNAQRAESKALITPFTTGARNIASHGFTATWDSIPNATRYFLRVSSDPLLTAPVEGWESVDVGNIDTFNVAGLTENTLYYYGVMSETDRLSAWSAATSVVKTTGGTSGELAANLSGVNNYIDLSAHISKFAGKNTGAITGWFKGTQYGNILKMTGATGNSLQLWLGNCVNSMDDESIWFIVQRDNTLPLSMGVREGHDAYLDGKWHHFAVITGDGNNRILIDGIERDPHFYNGHGNKQTQEFTNITSPATLHIGKDVSLAVDELAFYKNPITNEEVRERAHKKLTGDEVGLVAYYSFDNSSAFDDSGLGREGTVEGTVAYERANVLPTPFMDQPMPGVTLADFSWQPIEGATNYIIDVALDKQFQNKIVSNQLITEPNFHVEGLDKNSKYFYRVKSKVDTLWSEFSGTDEFFTLPGNALVLDGIDDYVSFDEIANYPSDEATIECWVKADNTSGTDAIWAHNNNVNGDNQYVLMYNSDNEAIDIATMNPDGTYGSIGPFNNVNLLSSWHHLAVSIKKDGESFIYVDGKKVGQFTHHLPPIVSGYQFAIGQEWDNNPATPSQFFKGEFDEFRVWDIALTEEEIRANMNLSEPEGASEHYIAHYTFDEIHHQNDGVYVFKDMAKQNDATLVGGATIKASEGVINPITLEPTDMTPGSFVMHINDIASAESFEVEIAHDATFVPPLALHENIGKETTFNATGLCPGVKYYYRVRAIYDEQNISAWSSVDTVWTVDEDAAITELFASQGDYSQNLKLSWECVNNYLIDEFEVKRRLLGTEEYEFIGLVPNNADFYQFTDTLAEPGTYYEYTVQGLSYCYNNDTEVDTTNVGYNIPALSLSKEINDDTQEAYIRLDWEYHPDFCRNVEIERVNTETGITQTFQEVKDSLVYRDGQVELCVPYQYQLIAKTSDYGDVGSQVNQFTLEEDIFEAIDTLDASKGYFDSKITLNWVSYKQNIIDEYQISRRKYANNDTWQVIKIIDKGTTQAWIDEDAIAGEYYEYLIIGIGSCGENALFTDSVTSVGFRQPEGTIAGQITYEGGNPVFDVKLTVNYDEPDMIVGNCLAFDGSDNLQINPVNTFDFTEGKTVEMWLNPQNLNQSFVLYNNSGMVIDYLTDGTLSALSGAALTTYNIKTDNSDVWESGSWNHVAVAAGSDGMELIINGELVTSVPDAPALDFDTTMVADGYSGLIDELRVWNTVITDSLIDRRKGLMLGRDEEGMICNLRFDEKRGNYIFDHSRMDNEPNKSHATIYGAQYSDAIPSLATLSLGAKTERNGNYMAEGVWFKGSGDSYSITPSYGVHEFDPATRSMLISENSQIYSNQNFTDISAFLVTGNVKYYGADFPVEGIMIAVDGQISVTAEGQPVTTDNLGNFEIEVPIGEHFISIQKINHVFSEGYFPPKDENGEVTYHLFDNPVSGIQFVDSTFMTVAGRIVGGTVEGDKEIGFGKSKNNLGVCDFTIEAVKGYPIDGSNNTITVATDAQTGEYEMKLYPEQYQFVIDATHNLGNAVYDFNSIDDLTVINLADPMLENTATDTATIEEIVDGDTTYYDTVYEYKYHLKRNWIYRSVPSIEVLSENSDAYFYDSVMTVQNADGDSVSFTLINADGTNRLDYPVFQKGAFYNTKINVFEEYENIDNNEVDRVAVQDGKITVINGCATYPAPVDYQIENGQVLYEFIGGFPNPTLDNTSPELSYTKTFEVHSYTGQGGSMHSQWPESGPFRAYVFGGIPTGQNFVTQGPDQLDFILRDPPGSNSSAYFEEGFTVTSSTSHSFDNSSSINNSLEVDLGWELTTFVGFGAGVINTSEQVANAEAGIGFESNYSGGHSREESTTFTQSYSTSDDPAYVGEMGDLFFGHSTNITYGVSNCINIIPVGSGEEELDADIDGFTVGLNKGLNLGLTYGTSFIYTQNHIENYLIPDLEMFYEQLMAEGNPDSANFYLQQADLWRKTLATNEYQKYQAIKRKNVYEENKNISFDAGAIYEESMETEVTETSFSSFEFTINETVSTELGFEIFGMGSTWKMDSEYSQSTTNESENSTTESKTVGFILNDGDQGDYFSIDVLKDPYGNGPVFSTLGGQSACPYEGGTKVEYADYYNAWWVPSDFNNDFQLNYPTMKIEVPEISAVNSIVAGVPDNEPAVYTLKLANLSEVNADNWFTLKLDAASNPYGAKLKVDGATIINGVSIMIPGGTTLTKTLELEKGQSSVNDYENINLILHSECQFDPTDDVADVADTVTITANFVPTCTNVEVLNPSDNWLMNVDANDLMPVKIGGYNVNHGSFEKVAFQYKAEAASSWNTKAMFFNDTTEYGDYAGEKYKIEGSDVIFYDWDMSALQDKSYQIRATSVCADGSVTESAAHTGILDGVRPQVFGTPSPADGILSPNDELMITFNEPIEEGAVTSYNIDVQGVLNGAEINHGTSVQLDGQSDYIQTPEGINLRDASFSIEFWMRKGVDTTGVLFSQGNSSANELKISIEEDSIRLSSGTASIAGANNFDDANWHHYALVYDNTTSNASIYIDDELSTQKVLPPAQSSGKVYFGKSTVTDDGFLAANIHDVRIWRKPLSFNDVIEQMNISLVGNEFGLTAYWPMNEATGTLLADEAHSRNATLTGSWTVEPSSTAYAFNGIDQALTFETGSIPMNSEMDMTIEMWFKAQSQAAKTTLFSNGNDTVDGYEPSSTLNIYMTAAGLIEVVSGENSITTTNAYTDDVWHHMAYVLNRRGFATLYIDGEKVNSIPAAGFGGMASASAYIGARGYIDNSLEHQTNGYFEGVIDELRIWKLARTQEQVELYMNNRLAGDEIGLMAYFPFETYEETMGVMLSTPTLDDQSVDLNSENYTNHCGTAVEMGENGFTETSPNIKRERAKSNVNFDFVINSDQMIITPTDPLAMIEKCVLEITVQNIQDKHSNFMASPVTWTAYIKKNQVVWGADAYSFEKEVSQPLSYTTTVVNSGGVEQSFVISNLPAWLSVTPESGRIAPDSELEVEFTVNDGLNIGYYAEDIFLESNSGYNERLALNLRVYKQAPNWEVDESAFQSSMNFVAQLSIKDIISNDKYDMIGVFAGEECRGVCNLEYKANYDTYFAFLVVYGNDADEELTYRVWDASEGKVYSDVAPVYNFAPNQFFGSITQPVMFTAGSKLDNTIALSQGWNWLSFNLDMNDATVNGVFNGLDLSGSDVVKHAEQFSSYDGASEAWYGSLNELEIGKLYRAKIANGGNLLYKGSEVKASEVSIELVNGWNRIGYVPTVNMTVDEAFAGFEPTMNDVVKSQYQFAMYDGYGWIGSLTFMEPGKGYMYSSGNSDNVVFTYPDGTTLGKKSATKGNEILDAAYGINAGEYEYSMSVVAQVSGIGNLTNNKVGAYINGELRGVADIASVENYANYCFVTVYGTEDELNNNISFKLLSDNKQYELEGASTLMGNTIDGSLNAPVELKAGHLLGALDNAEAGLFAYPNPFNTEMSVFLNVKQDGNVLVEVFNVLGDKVDVLVDKHLEADHYQFDWKVEEQADYSTRAGVYFIHVRMDNETRILKVIKE